jgi:hypothetical protein
VYWFNDNWQNPFTILFEAYSSIENLIYANTDGLSSGVNTVSMFFQDNNGLWSSVVRDSFVKSQNIFISCPGNQKFVSGIGAPSNISYQWQVYQENTFTDIQNSDNYLGATTDTLIILNAPQSWHGHQYRCMVNTTQGLVNTNPSTLRFIHYWMGTVDNNWENSGNWECNTVPTPKADVIINSGAVHVNSNVDILSVTISNLSKLTITQGSRLSIKGK